MFTKLHKIAIYSNHHYHIWQFIIYTSWYISDYKQHTFLGMYFDHGIEKIINGNNRNNRD